MCCECLHLLEDIMATLLEEDGIFGSYADLKQVVPMHCALCHHRLRLVTFLFGCGLHSTHHLAHVLCMFLTNYTVQS